MPQSCVATQRLPRVLTGSRDSSEGANWARSGVSSPPSSSTRGPFQRVLTCSPAASHGRAATSSAVHSELRPEPHALPVLVAQRHPHPEGALATGNGLAPTDIVPSPHLSVFVRLGPGVQWSSRVLLRGVVATQHSVLRCVNALRGGSIPSPSRGRYRGLLTVPLRVMGPRRTPAPHA